MSNNKLCVQKEHRELLVRSETTKKFPKILDLLIQNDKLSFAQLDNDAIDSETKNLLLYSIKDLIKDASSEWRGTIEVIDLGNDRVKCTLCRQPNRYMCHIVNEYNGTKINVGTECITYFKGLNYTAIKRNKQKLIKDSNILRRKAEINEAFPYLNNQILTARKKVLDNPYVLPLKLENNVNAIIDDIQDTYNRFMKNAETKECFERIRNNLTELSRLFLVVDTFNDETGNDIFSCDLTTEKWLVSQNKSYILDEIKMNDGKITCKTISHIYNDIFINKFLNQIKTITDTNLLMFIKHEKSMMFFQYTYYLSFGANRNGAAYQIDLNCTSAKFMKNYGMTFFAPVSIEPYELLKTLDIDLNLTNEIYDLVNELLESYGYGIRHDDGYFEFLKISDNEWTYRAKGDVATFFSNIKKYLITDSRIFKENLFNILKRLSKWEKRSEIEAIERASRNRPKR